MAGTGKRATWSYIYVGDRPREILGLTEAQEADISQFIGFSAKDQDGNSKDHFELVYEGTDAPTLTNFASTPVGTIIWCPNVADVSHYIHQAKTDTPVVGDWKVVATTTVTE